MVPESVGIEVAVLGEVNVIVPPVANAVGDNAVQAESTMLVFTIVVLSSC